MITRSPTTTIFRFTYVSAGFSGCACFIMMLLGVPFNPQLLGMAVVCGVGVAAVAT